MTDTKKPTRLDLRHLRYALAVADASGFRAAAETLNIAQPAISKADIAALKEKRLRLGQVEWGNRHLFHAAIKSRYGAVTQIDSRYRAITESDQPSGGK